MPPDAPIDVVIATRDRRADLLATLARLTGLRDVGRVLVVDNGSGDGSPAAVREAFPQVDVVALDANLGAAARNVGVERAGSPYVAFADDDSWWAPGALARASAVLDAHPRVAVLAARVLVGPGERLDPTCEEMARSPLSGPADGPGPAVLGFVACGAIVRRDAFLAVGGFDERYGIGGEEAQLAMRLASAGWELRYVPDVVAHHHPTPSPSRSGRVARTLRNDLWTTWTTHPLGGAVAASWRLVRASGWRRSTAAGIAGALRGAGWVARERRPAPPALAAALRLLGRR
jgi:GT2 family glycosyltransferase